MMKNFYTLLLIFIASTGFAQVIPNGYYNSATGSGYTLKTQLYNIIKNHSDQGYGGLYTTYIASDRDYYYDLDGTLLDMYSEIPAGADSYEYSATNTSERCGNYNSEGDCYNREHIIPQSVFGSAAPMQSDAHFVVPSDGFVNGARGNLPFGLVSTANYTSSNGSKRGPNVNSGYSAGYAGTVFEPIDEFKGDIARMYFYFVTRYQNQVSNWDYDMFNGTSNQALTNQAVSLLLTWHNQDPVNDREIDRNAAVYDRQNNRNPFIDHPEYAMQIWGSLLDTESISALQSTAIYPNPSNDHLINIATEVIVDNIQLINISGQIIKEITNPQFQNKIYSIEDLPSGFYFIRISNHEGEVTKKVLIN